MPIFRGIASARKILGIPFVINEEVKDVARHGPGMPSVQCMLKLQHVAALEAISRDETKNEAERAYAGAEWLSAAASTRTIDM